MRTSVKINQLSLCQQDDRQRLSANVDGDLVWFDFPVSITIEPRSELFITTALLEAMISDLPIELTDDMIVSPTLLKQLDTLQNIYCCWNSDLHKIAINGGKKVTSKSNGKVASFYSGGVDGAYTLCKHQDELSALITIAGFDTINKMEQWPLLINKNRMLTKKLGFELIDINNNIRQFVKKRKISNNFQHGLTLAGIAITLGFSRVYIPTSSTYDDLVPWGSHPMTDPLWSIENRHVLHDGVELSRCEKVEYIAKYPLVFDNLQVCWNNLDHNCGYCSKCMRTRAALYVLGIKNKALLSIDNVNELDKLSVSGEADIHFMQDLMNKAHVFGKIEAEKVFRRIIHRYLIKYYFEGLMKTLFGDKAVAFVHKVRGTLWINHRVTMQGKKKIKIS